MGDLLVIFLWPVFVGGVAALWARRPRTTPLGIVVAIVVAVGLSALRLGLDWQLGSRIAAELGERLSVPWLNIAQLAWAAFMLSFGSWLGWRSRSRNRTPDRASTEVGAYSAAVAASDSLDEALPPLGKFLVHYPGRVNELVPALRLVREHDATLCAIGPAEIERRLADAGVTDTVAAQLVARVLVHG